ncbi:uncharacterized protein LOC123307378 [Coccinella septempunctata]|uniref:uncharacterized protein LOC123307378 n=1 Tax=Coccinella septempunctata TaxID=41139 RepID=UPI001D0706D9|nr:uncharacterized protein LOC123307378 [Coccinella septempunctata]
MSPKLILLFIGLCCCLKETLGHGMMLEPPNRSSLWRFYPNVPANYDDDGNFCGGMTVQWDTFGGKCGVCGDVYNQPHPQENENTGKYGKFGVVRTYKAGSTIDVGVLLTTSHRGNFKYSLCVLEDPTKPESGEDCFQPLTLSDGSSQYNIPGEENDSFNVTNAVVLPPNLTCDRCVLRWHYTAGNNWGKCDDGTYADGCGPQETFRSCSDIRIEA